MGEKSNAKREKWIKKIRALFNKENGGTPEEVYSALQKARELMQKFGITEQELNSIEGEIPIGGMLIYKNEGGIPKWIMHLAGVIGSNMRVMAITLGSQSEPNVVGLYYYGTETDCEMAGIAFQYASGAAVHFWEEFVRQSEENSIMGVMMTRRYNSIADLLNSAHPMYDEKPTEHHKQSYLLGFGVGLAESFKKQNECTALVLQVPALVKQSFAETFPDMQAATYAEDVNQDYARRGYGDGLYYGKNKKGLKSENRKGE
jgi:hypothetical protein